MPEKSKLKKQPADKPEGKRRRTIKRKSPSAKSQCAETGLQESKERFRQLFKSISSGVAIYEARSDGNNFILKDINIAAEKIDKIKKEDIIGKSVLKVFPKVRDCGLFDVFQRVWRTGQPEHHPMSFYEDKRITGWRENYVYKLPTGEIVAIYADVTAQKQAEEILRQSEEKYRSFINNAPECISVVQDGAIKFANSKIEDLTGYSLEELNSLSSPSILIHPDDQEIVMTFHYQRFKGGEAPTAYSFRMIDKYGNVKWVDRKIAQIMWEGKPAVLVFDSNITERKLIEEALKESERRYRSILDDIEEGYFETDLAGNFTFVNDTTCNILGYTKEEMIDMNYRVPTVEEDVESLYQAFNQVYLTNKPLEGFSWKVTRKDGAARVIEALVTPLQNKEGDVIGFRGIGRDITERKRANEQLEKWAHVFEHAEWGVSLSSAGSQTLEIMNPAYARMHGYTVAELTGQPIANVYHPERHAELAEHIRLAEEIGHHTFESKHIRKDGTVFPVVVDITTVKDKTGQVQYRVANIQDITDYKRAEEALRLSATEWRVTFDAMNAPVCLLDIEGKIQRCNIATTKLLEKPFGEIVGQPYWKLIYGKNAPVEECPAARVWQSHRREVSTLQLFDRWFDVVTEPISDEAGNTTGAVYIMLDITERKKAEEALRENVERYRSLVDTSPDMVTVTTPDGKLAFINNAGVRLLGGTSPEQFVGKPVMNYISPPYRKAATERIKEWAGGKRIHTSAAIQEKHVRLDGTEVDVELVGALIVYGGKPAMQVVSRDITERKRMEKALKASEERYRTIFESATEGILVGDSAAEGDMSTKRFKYVNPALCKLLGYSEHELIQMSLIDLHPKEALKRVASDFETISKGKKASSLNVPILRKDGAIAYTDIHTTHTLIDGTRHEVAFFTDVTQRKLADEEQKKSTQKLLGAMKATIQAMSMTVEMRDPYTSGHQRHVAELAAAIALEIGLPEEQVEGIRLAGVVHDIGKIYVPAEILSKPGQLSEMEFRLIKTHPQAGHDILEAIEFPWPIAQMVLQHHERMDGSGYPSGLSGKDILQGSRTLAVADVVEAMASHRPYRPSLGIDKALEEISQKKGILYDTEVADACLKLFKQKGFKLE